MGEPGYRAAHVSEIAAPTGAEAGRAAWHAVRRAFAIGSFGVNVYVASAAGDVFVSEHDEIDTKHEELFFVACGRATFTVAGGTVDAPAGTFVYVRDPALVRGALAEEAGTTLLAIGGEPGRAYEVSLWEQEYDRDA
jgi:hypothetical protein